MTAQPWTRKRKAHTKSRKGCGNCKTRQVKCDEQKPTCQNCRRHGVLCNYGQKAAHVEGTLQVSMNGPYHMGILPSPSAKTAVLGVVNEALRRESFSRWDPQNPAMQLTSRDLDTLARFQFRTSLSLATTGSQHLYSELAIQFACSHPFFMHLALSITMTHDRHLESSPPQPPSVTELFHLYQGTSIFNKSLSGTLTSAEKDTIWAAGSLLASSTLAQIDATTPEQAWPLAEPTDCDLSWLMAYDTKRAIWRIADPTRSESCHYPMSAESWWNLHAPCPESSFKKLPQELIQLLGLDVTDELQGLANPYRVPAHTLDNILGIQSSQTTVMCFLSFVSLMPREFRALVQGKDPFALILMAYWYAHFSQSRAWHIWRRCILECQSVCIYLARYHSDIPYLDKILDFPQRYSAVGAV